jgi:hypothetical protein
MGWDLPERNGPSLSLASWEEAEHLFYARRKALVWVDRPIVLISQIQRSGGTLMNTLLDGHPQLFSHPYELHIGYPTKHDWPTLDVEASVDAWFEMLAEPRLMRLFREGYRKATTETAGEIESLPFTLVPSLMQRLFRIICRERRPASPREIIDRYFTAFFNAWIDCQGLREPDKRWINALAQRVTWGESRERLRTDYPDGRLIAILRDPRGWWASARGYTQQYAVLSTALELWSKSTEEMLAAKQEAPGRVLIVGYEGLVERPRDSMREIARWLKIEWDPILEHPTFNRWPVRPNSSHGLLGAEVQATQAYRWKDVLEPEDVHSVEERVLEQYRDAVKAIDVPGSARRPEGRARRPLRQRKSLDV